MVILRIFLCLDSGVFQGLAAITTIWYLVNKDMIYYRLVFEYNRSNLCLVNKFF